MDNIFFCGKDIALFLEYTNTNKAILNNISNKNKISIDDFSKVSLQGMPLSHSIKDFLESQHKQSIYISEAGLYELILNSKK